MAHGTTRRITVCVPRLQLSCTLENSQCIAKVETTDITTTNIQDGEQAW
jgi:hypothetical protein